MDRDWITDKHSLNEIQQEKEIRKLIEKSLPVDLRLMRIESIDSRFNRILGVKYLCFSRETAQSIVLHCQVHHLPIKVRTMAPSFMGNYYETRWEYRFVDDAD
jgi:hypothetical protein